MLPAAVAASAVVIAVGGLVRIIRSDGGPSVAPLVGLAIAAFLHGLWNYSTIQGTFIVVYATLMLPAFLGVVAFAVYRRRSERPLLAEALQDAAERGLLPATDIAWLVDLRARRHARRWALHHGGKQAERGMREYQAAAIELGYLHHRYLRGTAPDDFAVRGQEHVEELRLIRPYISFPGQVVPTR